jgi:adenylate kinase
MNVVFLGGIHGVGKSTLCERLASENNVLHVKASRLIRDANTGAGPLRGKSVQDVATNQAVLVARFDEVLATCTARAILLDGHFALCKHDGTIDRISPCVFAALSVSSIICLQDSPSSIAARLRARDGSAPSEAYLAAFQAAELEHAEAVSSALGVRLAVVNALDADAATTIASLL